MTMEFVDISGKKYGLIDLFVPNKTLDDHQSNRDFKHTILVKQLFFENDLPYQMSIGILEERNGVLRAWVMDSERQRLDQYESEFAAFSGPIGKIPSKDAPR